MGAVRQEDADLLGDRVPEGRPGQQGQRLGPLVLVDEVEVAHGDQFGGDRRHRRVREAVEDVLAPHVHGVEETGVVRFREVALAGLQFVRVQDHVRGPDQGEVGEHSAGREGLFAPLPGQFGVHVGEFVLTHDLGERAAGQDEFTGGDQFPLLVGQRERAQPRLVAGLESRVPDEREDGVGQLLGVRGVLLPAHPAVVVQGGGHGCPYLGRGEHRARRRGQRAQLLEERVGGGRVGDLEAEPGEDLGVDHGPVRGGQQHLPGPDGRPSVGQRHGKAGEPVGVDAREAVVEPLPPLRLLLEPGEPVDGIGQRDACDAQRPQFHPPFQTGGQQGGQDFGEHPYGVGAGALDDLGLARAEDLRQFRLVTGLRCGREGGWEKRRAWEAVENRLPQRPVQLALPQRAGDQPDDPFAHRPPAGEEFGVHVRRPLHEEVGERSGCRVPAGGVQREGRDEQRGDTERLVAGRRGVHDGAGAGVGRGAVGVGGHGPGERPVRAQPLLDGPAGEEFGGERPVRGRRTPPGRTVSRVLHDDEGVLGAAADRADRVRLDHDLLEPGEGEEESVVDAVQEALGEVGGGGVAQREDDDGVVGVGRGALGGERESQQRDMAVAAADLVAEPGAVPCGVGGVLTGLGEGPADPAVPADDGGLVGDGEHGGEADAEAADRAVLAVALGGGTQGGEGLDTGRVQRGAGVGGEQDALAEGEPEPSRHALWPPRRRRSARVRRRVGPGTRRGRGPPRRWRPPGTGRGWWPRRPAPLA